ncbi:TenA family protein [Halopenitus sp. H-Gu1]|uniref:TenA family protein n=1 Tax=Halopenitus sp. H-Gu1 TaxID=3242697 RepID=UPI00359D581F
MTDRDSEAERSPDDPGGTAQPSFKRYTDDRPDATVTEWLRDRSEPNWSAAIDNRFVRQLAADELDDEVFRRYLVQDYAFVGTLVGAFGHAVGTAPTMTARSRLVEFLSVLTDEEDDYFERSFHALSVPEEDVRDPPRTPTTRALEDLLERAGREGGYAETLAVLVPAEWIYLEWARAVADADPSRFYLAEWIDLHANPEFESFVTWLRSELDRHGETVSPRRRRRLDRLFFRTVELEVAFFEEAFEERPIDGARREQRGAGGW